MAGILDRVVRWLTGEEAGPAPLTEAPIAAARPAPEPVSQELPPVENDAASYGVTVEEVQVAPGTRYWRVTRVHHLTPDENRGRHHIFIEALTPEGDRAFGSRARITWEGGEQIVTVDKPPGEPGANFPMWKWQVCSVEMLDLPSDKVHNLRTDHPDEPNPDGSTSGNTLFHHSFLVEFRQVVAPVRPGHIQGQVENGTVGMEVRLLRVPPTGEEETVAQTTLAADGRFTLADVSPGTYQIAVADVRHPVTVQAGATTEVIIRLPVANSVIQGVVHGAQGHRLYLLAGENGQRLAGGVLPPSGRFRLRNLRAGTYFLEVWSPDDQTRLLRSRPLEVDGHNTLDVALSLVDEEPTPPRSRLVLFGDPASPQVQELVTRLGPELAARGLPFGFTPQAAALAEEVIVVGDGHMVPEFELIYLWTQGIKVHRLTGSPETVLESLTHLLTT